MKTHLFAISLLSLAALTHTNYQIAAAAPDSRSPIQSRILRHAGPVVSAAFSPNGTMLATGCWDQKAYIWKAHSGEFVRILDGHKESPIIKVAFSPDGSMLVTVYQDGTTCIWNTRSWELLNTLGSVASVEFSYDGSRLAVGFEDGAVSILDTRSWKSLHTLHEHGTSITRAPDGAMQTHAALVALSPDGATLAAVFHDDDTAHIWNADSGELLFKLSDHTDPIISVAFSPDGTKLAVGFESGAVSICNTRSWELSDKLTNNAASIISLAFSPDGSKLATSTWNFVTCIWDTSSCELLHTLRGYTNALTSAAFSPDGSKFAAGSRQGTACIWDTHSWELLHTLQSHTNVISKVAFSPNGSNFATSSCDGTVRIWHDTRAENAIRGAAEVLLSACHPRLGEASPAHVGLDPYTIREIINLAHPDSFGPIEQEHHAQAEGPTPALHQPVQQGRQGLTRYLPTFAIAAPSIAAAAWLLRHFMHR